MLGAGLATPPKPTTESLPNNSSNEANSETSSGANEANSGGPDARPELEGGRPPGIVVGDQNPLTFGGSLLVTTLPESDVYDVAVLGAGAAGLVAAARAAELGGRVVLLEKNRKAGVKILMSGGTRCNITNARGLRRLESVSGPIDRIGQRSVVLGHVVVGVPAVGIARIQLHESHAMLDHPPRQEAPRAELPRLLPIQPVQPLGLFGLARKIHECRRGTLHPVRQFIRANPGRQFVVAAAIREVLRISLGDKIEHPPLPGLGARPRFVL